MELRDLQVELQRAAALTDLAVADLPLPDLLDRAVGLAREELKSEAVGVYVCTREGSEFVLAAQTGSPLSLESSGLPARDDADASFVAVLPGDSKAPMGFLRVSGTVKTEDAQFVRNVARVIETALVRDARARELLLSERRLIEAQRISHVGSYDFELATNTNLWSDQLYRIYGREPQSFNASYEVFLEMVMPEDREHVIAVHQHSLETREPFEMEERIVWPDGQVRTLASWGEVVVDDQGQPVRMVGICWDITERKQIEGQLVHEALHDRLTGLPNRALLMDRLTQELAVLDRRDGPIAVLFIDVDRFKVVNDSLGHDAGDVVLLELARRFSAVMRPGDTVARFGGDEFVVLSQDLASAGEALAIAERLRTETLRPITIDGDDLVVTVSMGIAIGTQAADLAGTLVRDADAAMYRAKRAGRGRWVVFADEMRDEAVARLDTEQQLRRALAEGQLRVHYQPVVDIRSQRILGVEALVRWQHPTRGLLVPRQFVPIAEETGLIVPIDQWVLQTALAQHAVWQTHNPDLTMSVNLSGEHFLHHELVAHVAATLKQTGAVASNVALEITETILMRDVEDTLAVLHQLRQLGVKLHVDDFGTGFSSLSYLKRFPVDALKVDQSFVSGLGVEAEDRAIVQAVVALADALGLATIAEGVEDADQCAALDEIGCSTAQGYLFSRPLAAVDVTALLQGVRTRVPAPRSTPVTI